MTQDPNIRPVAPSSNPGPPGPPGPLRRRGGAWWQGIIGLLVLVALVLAIFWIVDLVQDDDAGAGADVGVTLTDIADDPAAYAGAEVSVSGEVGEQPTDRLFLLGDEGVWVFFADGVDAPASDVAIVDGVVEHGDAATITSAIGADPPPDLQQLGGEGALTVINASSVILEPLEGDPPADEDIEPPVTAPADVLSLEELMGNISNYMDEEVTVGGSLLAGVSAHTATFDGTTSQTEDLLVLVPQAVPGAFPAAANARVTGTIVEFDVAEAEEALGVDLDEEVLDDFEGDPALLGDSVHYFIAGEFTADVILGADGQEVTLTGEIGEIVADGVFLAANVVVILADGVEFDPVEDALIQAHGIAAVGLEDVDAEAVDALSKDQREEYEGHPLLIADSVELVP